MLTDKMAHRRSKTRIAQMSETAKVTQDPIEQGKLLRQGMGVKLVLAENPHLTPRIQLRMATDRHRYPKLLETLRKNESLTPQASAAIDRSLAIEAKHQSDRVAREKLGRALRTTAKQ